MGSQTDLTELTTDVLVLGAGVVGVSCALALQRRGLQVTLLDKRGPGQETSFGNGGVLARSSLISLNNPALLRSLPKMLGNRAPQLRYNAWFLLKNFRWTQGFLRNSRPQVFDETVAALDSLIRLSIDEHRRLLAQAHCTHRLRDTGWIFLYRTQAAFEAVSWSREIYAQFGIKTSPLTQHEITELEPSIEAKFERGLWINDALSVDNPGKVVEAYAKLFVEAGGKIVTDKVCALRRSSDGYWQLSGTRAEQHRAKRVVIALGPWSKTFLAPLGIRIPMVFERGYHQHYQTKSGAVLTRPLYDTAKGYVLSPMEQGIRLTTGVELTDQFARPNYSQLAASERAAREVFPLGASIDPTPWLGCRPTLPDSRPMIGAINASGCEGLWAAFGHQHIGFSTSTGTATLLAALMCGEAAPIDAAPFRADRFRLS
jgi:D-amino-acid dehydrogenase